MRKISLLLVISMVLAMFFIGCGKESKREYASNMYPDAPEWVSRGSGAFMDELDKVFYAVGSASGIRNMALLRTAADNRARAEMAKVFQYYSASIMSDYMASTLADDPTVTSEQQHVDQSIKTIAKVTLSGVIIVTHWKDKKSGELFSLARVDLEAFKGNLDRVQNLDQRVKDYVSSNSDRLYGEFDLK